MEIQTTIEGLLGINTQSISADQMIARAVLVYLLALIIIRVGHKRFLGKNTAFDVILAIVLGSVISRAINGSAPFFPTLVTSFVLVLFHGLISSLAFRIPGLRSMVKGHERWLVQGGKVQWDVMKQTSITERDLIKAVRGKRGENTLDHVDGAILERDGSISILPKAAEPRIIEIIVAEGVQTVRIQLE